MKKKVFKQKINNLTNNKLIMINNNQNKVNNLYMIKKIIKLKNKIIRIIQLNKKKIITQSKIIKTILKNKIYKIQKKIIMINNLIQTMNKLINKMK